MSNEFSKLDRMQQYANILSNSRYAAGKSQEFMAAELGVSRKTIQNWETGISFPDVFKMGEWFKILGVNPTQYYLRCFNEDVTNVSEESSDDEIKVALISIIEELPSKSVRDLMYILYGSHGSDPESVLQMVNTHLHLPMYCRVSVAKSIEEMYTMCEARDELVEMHHVKPDITKLREAINKGREAAMRKENNYC